MWKWGRKGRPGVWMGGRGPDGGGAHNVCPCREGLEDAGAWAEGGGACSPCSCVEGLEGRWSLVIGKGHGMQNANLPRAFLPSSIITIPPMFQPASLRTTPRLPSTLPTLALPALALPALTLSTLTPAPPGHPPPHHLRRPPSPKAPPLPPVTHGDDGAPNLVFPACRCHPSDNHSSQSLFYLSPFSPPIPIRSPAASSPQAAPSPRPPPPPTATPPLPPLRQQQQVRLLGILMRHCITPDYLNKHLLPGRHNLTKGERAKCPKPTPSHSFVFSCIEFACLT